MPSYRYKSQDPERDCPICGEDGFETLQRLSEPMLTECPTCGGAIRRAMSTAPVCVTSERWNTKKLLSDGNLKKNGFKKLVKKSDGSYENVLQD